VPRHVVRRSRRARLVATAAAMLTVAGVAPLAVRSDGRSPHMVLIARHAPGWKTSTTVAASTSTTVASTTTTSAPPSTTTSTTSTPTTTAPAASPGTVTGFVGRQGGGLVLDGAPFRFTGLNNYTANLRNNCVSGYAGGNADGTEANDLAGIASGTNGHTKVIRAWFFQRQATTNGVRDWSAFDHTLAAAKAAGFRVIATLANGWGTCEAVAPDGTKATDQNGVGYRDISWYQGGYKTFPEAGHTGGASEGGTVSYRNWVQEVAFRYRDDPTILAWQMMNEGNGGTWAAGANGNFPCPDANAANAAILGWANDVVPLVKSIDPNHLVGIGMLQDSCGTWQAQNTRISDVPGNDLCEYHDYSSPATTMPSGLSYMISACAAIGRPVIVGEAGIDLGAVGGSLSTRAQDFDAKIRTQLGAGVAGIVPWVWNGSPWSLDYKYEIRPGDPLLAALAQY
jgi:mannan endo-1,4-beta-mannosidase